MIKILSQIYEILNPKDRRLAYALLGLIFITSLIDVVGIASVMPFIAILSEPDLVNQNRYVSIIYKIAQQFGHSSEIDFLFFAGSIVFLLLFVSAIFKILTMYLQVRFAHLRERDIGERLLKKFLGQNYQAYLTSSSSEVDQKIFSETHTVVVQVVMPLLILTAQSLLALFIFLLLFVVDAKVAFVVLMTISIAYGGMYYSVRFLLVKIGNSRIAADKLRFKIVSEAFGAFKLIKLAQNENEYISRFNKAASTFAENQASAQSIAVLPRFLVELIAFGGLILIILYLLGGDGELNDALPVVTLYALAGYRLMPAGQQIYMSISQLRYTSEALDKLHHELHNAEEISIADFKEPRSIFERNISLDNVCYSYLSGGRAAVNNVTLQIKANEIVGLVGVTGSGKSTVMDILLGLLQPSSGQMKIDDVVVNEHHLKSWKAVIGHVPQDVYLIDGTIAENIAISDRHAEIDHGRLVAVSKAAKVHDFVISNARSGYDTIVGERGMRLSGGQIQRIGIARSLYSKPKVLILDEATSALDNQTEKEVMNAITTIRDNITVVMVAHRLSTLQHCDNIFVFDNGSMVDQGSYKYLSKSSHWFKALLPDKLSE